MTTLPWAVHSVHEFNTSRITQILRYLLVKSSTHSTWTQLSSSVACAIISYFHINGTVDVNPSLPVLYLNQLISIRYRAIILFVELQCRNNEGRGIHVWWLPQWWLNFALFLSNSYIFICYFIHNDESSISTLVFTD